MNWMYVMYLMYLSFATLNSEHLRNDDVELYLELMLVDNLYYVLSHVEKFMFPRYKY